MVIYLAVACYLDLAANVIYGDAFSRVEIAQRILLSRDPHLAAIGFIWPPLPVIALLPLVPLKALWPQLITLALAGGIVSAVSMSAAVVQVRGMLAEIGLSRPLVLILTGAFAFHPETVFFAANGMSEAMLLWFLLMATRYLARWVRDSDLNSLIATGIALSLAYFTRSEAVAGALGVIAFVAVVSLLRNRNREGGLSTVVCDVAIVAAPITLAFVVWALASWVITGQAFERFTSVYDNRTVVSTGYKPWSGPLLSFTLSQLAALAPTLPAVLLMGVLVRLSRQHVSLLLACMGCLGATLAFMILAEFTGSIPDELRYYIVLVPMAVVIAGVCAAGTMRRPRIQGRWIRPVALMSVLLMIGAIPISARGMLSTTINPIASAYFLSVVSPSADNARGGRLNWTTERQVAADLDGLHLAPGAVLLDDYLGFPIIVTSTNPKQFVITSDRDFQSRLVDPRGTGIQYILVPDLSFLGRLDAINREYPTFFDDGGGLATLVKEYPKQGLNDSTWRLYRLN